MIISDLFSSKDACPVCGQTPCNCTHIAESMNPIGSKIKALYQKIYNAGDDAVEFMYYDSPIFAQYWDEYEGDLDSIIAEVDPNELQIILDELQSAVEDQGLAEANYSDTPLSTYSNNANPELRNIHIPGNMKHPGWKEPTWSFAEVAEKLGLTPKELQQLAFSLGNFPKKAEGVKSSYGSKAYYPRSEIKRWVNASGIRDIIKSRQGVAEGYDEDEGNPVMNAIRGRIMRTRPDLLGYDLRQLQAAIRDVALDVGDVDEIGTSDISGWVKRVEQQLSGTGVAEQQVNEISPYDYDSDADYYDALRAQKRRAQGRSADDYDDYEDEPMDNNDDDESYYEKYVRTKGLEEVEDQKPESLTYKDLFKQPEPGHETEPKDELHLHNWDEYWKLRNEKQPQQQKDVAEGDKKPEPPEADYGDDYQAMVSRLKKLAGMGPLKTVYDPKRRVYRNMPTAVQPPKK